MTIKELENKIEQAEKALFATKTITQWDAAVRHYNALKIRWYQHTGESILLEAVSIPEYNLYKINL
ncbi:hypothetical protein [Dysgonomonas sp. GY617]|uniref:hypothetical protein n=1 Tax=Dysgonomonas sp. GY617 TaxID=2780420 RepID=UPI00188399F5|nr:hypothetical protein [Dysgonomonas sp. GY617]MBF0576625.1 hypothetical protein [Dysgonomonas sp. GY617]